MTKAKEVLAPLGFLLTIPLLQTIYVLMDNPNRGAINLSTLIDRNIPFLKVFIIPYVGWYFFITLTLIYFCFSDRKTYYTTIISINFGLLACYLIYFIFPTTVPRPVLSGSDFLTKTVLLVYRFDPPFNCCPSIHCLTSYLMMKAAQKCYVSNRPIRFIINSGAALIIISTLFVKQHVIFDAVLAIIIGEKVFETVNQLTKESVVQWIEKPFSLLMTKRKLGT